MDIIGTPQLGETPLIKYPTSKMNLFNSLEKLSDFSISYGYHVSGGAGIYGDAGNYLSSIDSHGHVAFLQGFLGGGGTAIHLTL
jgi:hypothetical protein